MRQLILIKHASAKMDMNIPRTEWPLTTVGRERCAPLANALVDYTPLTLISSREPKAQETALLIGERLRISYQVIDGIQENDRSGMMITPTPVFRRRMATFFNQPDERVLGHESAVEALARFSAAIADMIAAIPAGNLAVVTHGAVLSLFVTAHNNLAAFPFWQHLGDPSFVALSLPDYLLIKTVKRITDAVEP